MFLSCRVQFFLPSKTVLWAVDWTVKAEILFFFVFTFELFQVSILPGRETRRGRWIKDQPEHIAILTLGSSVEYVGHTVVSFPEYDQWVFPDQLLDEIRVPGRGSSVNEPTSVASPNKRTVHPPPRLALPQELPGDVGAAGVDLPRPPLVLVLPEGLKAAEAAERGELYEMVAVEEEQLPDQLVVAVGGCPLDRGRVPPLPQRRLPPEGKTFRVLHLRSRAATKKLHICWSESEWDPGRQRGNLRLLSLFLSIRVSDKIRERWRWMEERWTVAGPPLTGRGRCPSLHFTYLLYLQIWAGSLWKVV